MSYGKARGTFTTGHELNRINTELRQLHGLVRNRSTPNSIQVPILGSASPSTTPVPIYPFTEPGQDYGNVGLMTVNIDLSASTVGYTKMTLTGNISLAFNNAPASGTFIQFFLQIVQDGVGGHTVTFPGSVASPPSIDTAAGATNIIMCTTFDGGVTYLAVKLSTSTSGFANTALSNLVSPTDINQSLRPNATSSLDLGTSGPDRSWRDLFIDRIRLRHTQSVITNAANITIDASNNMEINVDTGKKISMMIFGTEKARVDSTGINVTGGLTTSGSIVAGTSLQVPSYFFLNSLGCTISTPQVDITSSQINIGDSIADTVDIVAAIDTTLYPKTDGLRSLGSSSLRWRDLYIFNKIQCDGDIDMSAGSFKRIIFSGTSTIQFGVELTSATAGTASALPGNPQGYTYIKDYAGNFRLIAYWKT